VYMNKTTTCENVVNTPILLIGWVKGEMKGACWPRLLWRMGQCSADDGQAVEGDACFWVCRSKVWNEVDTLVLGDIYMNLKLG